MTPPAALDRRRRENTRARLLAAAEQVFVAKGLRVTVDDLVGAAGFTRGAFYSNFASIEQVFFAVFEAQSAAMLAAVREVVDEVPEDAFSLGLILERLRPISRKWSVVHTEFLLLAMRSEHARTVFREQHAMFEDEMTAVIGDVIARLGREPTVPAAQLSETAVALYVHSVTQETLGVGTLDTDQLTHVVLPQMLLGLSRPLADPA